MTSPSAISADAVPSWRLVDLASARREAGDLPEAERLLRDCRARFPGHGPAAAALALVLQLRGQPQESLATWRAAVSEFPDQIQAWWLVELAQAERRTGDPAEAERRLAEACGRFPGHAPAAAALAELLEATARPLESLAAWRGVIDAFPDVLQPWWLVKLAGLERRFGDLDAAERALRRCRADFPDHAPALAVLADLLHVRGRAHEADACWRRAFADFADTVQPWWFLCAAAARRALGEDDAPLLAELESAFPNHPESLARRARAAAAAEDWPAALDLWDALAAASTTLPPSAASDRAQALFRRGRVQEALDAWTTLTSMAPDFVPGVLAHVAAARELGRWDDVHDILARLIETAAEPVPAEWVAERLRARLHARAREVTDADLDRLVARFPTSPHAHMLGVEFSFTRNRGLTDLAARVSAGLLQAPHNRWLRAEEVRVRLARGETEAAGVLATGLISEADDHHASVAAWRVLMDRDGEEALRDAAEAAAGQLWPAEGGLVVVDFLLSHAAPWSHALALRLAQDLHRRFPGRPRLACARARALVAVGEDDHAREAIAALPDLCVSQDAQELRAWAAVHADDHDQAQVLWHGILARAYIAALHSPPPRLQRVSLQGAADEVEGVTAFTLVRNEMANLPDFLHHHRRIGVSRFVMVDHGSDDGGPDYLAAQPDVILYRTDDGFQASGAGMREINELSARHGARGWRLEVDADEAFTWPGWEITPLEAFVAWLDARGATAVASFMLDLFPRRLIANGAPAPREAYRFYDPPTAWAGLTRAPWRQPLGGVRQRLFQVREMLHKVSLVRAGAGAWLGSHTTTPVRIAPVGGLLLHYKLFNLARRQAQGPAGLLYMADRTPDLMRRHARYTAHLADLADRDLFDPAASAELADSLTLADRGLTPAPPEYRAWLVSRGACPDTTLSGLPYNVPLAEAYKE